MSIRVFGSPDLHRLGRFPHDEDIRIGHTRCGLHFVWGSWPKGYPRPKLPRCSACFA